MNVSLVKDFISKCSAEGVNIHAFSLSNENGAVLDFAIPPYEKTDRRQLYSMSKSFTSVAFGMLVDDGVITPQDKLVSVFPEYERYITDERKKNITFHNLLTMSSGHEACIMSSLYNSDEPVKAFFAAPMAFNPGERFVYSTSATFMVSAAVERLTNKSLIDFLDERLFSLIGIEKPDWETLSGIFCGGVGLYLSSDDVQKFAKLLYNKGMYNGQRIVSEEYLTKASSPCISNSDNGTHDWCAGYGYQIWCNDECGFRCDGAYGQLCVILPEQKAYFTLLGEVGNMQREMDLCCELVKNYDFASPLTREAVAEIVKDIYKPDSSDELPDIEQEYHNSRYGKIKISCSKERLEISFGAEKLLAGSKEYLYSEPLMYKAMPKIWLSKFDSWERVRVRSSFRAADGIIYITARSVNTPHTLTFAVAASDEALEIKISSATGNIHPEAGVIIAQKA